MWSRSAALVTLDASATAMNARMCLKSIGAWILYQTGMARKQRCIGHSGPDQPPSVTVRARFVGDPGGCMRGTKALLGAAALVLALPLTAFAQATMSGLVRDASGAVLPGVTVEASSPVLIEKVRSATTDNTGRYTIPDLRPGLYRMTFTLTGFATVVREKVELLGTSVITINADLKIGDLQETITVTGETPVVDVQTSTRRQTVIDDA